MAPTPPADDPSFRPVRRGNDLFGEHRGLGVSTIAFKVVPSDATGVLILENDFLTAGGPARHLHHDQDEWFYVLSGEFDFEVGDQRWRLRSGDALLAPRGVPHVWAATGPARLLVQFLPAGDMEAFFRRVTQANAMPPLDPALWRAHGMELTGPPLTVG